MGAEMAVGAGDSNSALRLFVPVRRLLQPTLRLSGGVMATFTERSRARTLALPAGTHLTETNLAADISTAGTLTISDVDSPATFVAQAATAGTYGTFAIDSAGGPTRRARRTTSLPPARPTATRSRSPAPTAP